ncbi:LOW QUALITY PROTEIN: SWI/SNF complex subunit SWI3D-like [Salvia splendens]|uniref:LOW QUALITY PROTEIN: SWI/SNF complex subunit SWI3D-like n=1 Tax=Salvia splendens TaxID=180675 RepID=UPI001C260CD6|nr:LOW QUALITY PROTEIN: SWI/SNF complex subunit SWI3D-like [Salvia splendens]
MDEKRRDSAANSSPTVSAMEASPSEQPTSRRRGGQKRKSAPINNSGGSSASQTASSKRQAREKPPAVPFPPIHMIGPCTRARVQPYNSSSLSEAALLKSEVEAREAAAARADEMSRLTENWEAMEAKIEAEYEAIRSRDASAHVVPIHAGWFSWTKIHPLEERMLPSFFNGKSESRTQEIYMEIRNWIMKKFHLDPDAKVELKHLSELTVGEPDARQEVMEFLDYWGLINYHPFPDREPAAINVDVDANKDESGKIESLVEKLFKFEAVQSWNPIVTRMNMNSPSFSSGLLPETVVTDELVKSEGPSVEYHCNSCSADCSRKRYHCQKQADFDLCAECYNNGKFGSDMSPLDFILMEPPDASGASGGKWTDQETLLLLEAIELFRDNWSEIAEHVATKTKAQCILHFVQMPIEDTFFNHDDENNDVPKENGAPDSIGNKDSTPEADKDSDAAPKDESQGGSTDNQDSSCPMVISKVNEVKESEASPEAGESFALKALKEAFEAVCSFPSPGDKLCLAEAGNPVMTLAAFLVRLVDPNIANASVCSLLKSLSNGYSSEQLAARHCIPLEDPPNDKKSTADAEEISTKAPEQEPQKDKDENDEKLEENPNPVVSPDDGNDGNKDPAPEENNGGKDNSSKDRNDAASPKPDSTDRSDTVKEPDVVAMEEDAKPNSQSAPGSSDLPNETDAEEPAVSTSQTELQSSSATEAEGVAVDLSHSKEPIKEEDMGPVSGNKEADALVISNSTEKDNITGDREADGSGNEKKNSEATKKYLDSDEKLKRAAVTALSAGAVKAKLLADQEEDQILQLSTFLIEKQLYKLETKLAFFADMENVGLRVRELLDRSKQRLLQERAQIIATRFGMPPGSARLASQNLPPNRASAAFPNAASRTLMGMNSLRPPVSRPVMPPNPTSSTMLTGNATGSSVGME